MKRILTFIIALVISVLGLNAQNFDVIDSELQMMLSQKSNEPVSINIILDSQFDADKLNNIDNKSEKREYVISELKKFSSENQNKVMAYLQAEEGNNVTNLKSHWLVNTISCTATRDVIYKTSELSGISRIAHNGKEKLIGDYKPMKAQKQRGLIQNVTTVGADQVWAEGYTGKDVIVAVLDSGVNSEHVDLKDHLWDGGSEYPDHGWNFIDNNSNTNDYNGHGTHCAGTICGDGTSGTQTGMAPDATLMCVKVLDDDGRGTLEALVSGIEFAVENGADILSISLGWTYPNSYVSEIMREMFENVMYAGVVASVAAGNERDGIDTIPIPYNINAPGNCPPPWLHPDQQANAGGLSAVVSVGAVDYYDEPAYFSSEGPVTWQGSQWHDYLLNSGVEIDENWLHYDNGIFETSIGGLESFYWGVMFPAATLQQHSGDMLSKISVYDYCADTPELLVYYGGDYAPEMLVHTQTFELTGSNSVVEIDLTSSLPIDRNENLWIVLFSNNGTDYPAAACSNTGNPNGRWLSVDGTTWEDIVDYVPESTWMIRAYVSDESGSAVAELKSINDYEYKSSKGKLSALKADSKRAGAASNDSNFGLIRPDVSAPGVDIVSAAYDDNYGFYSYSGTSMATPCVAGVMALMLDKNPDLTPADICRILETTATPLDYKKSNRTGSGRINAYEAYKMIEEENEEVPSGKSFFTFESGLDGWTTIDADNDGYKWINSSDYFAADLGPQGFNGSNCAMSQSYINEVGVLYPDNYLVSPEKYLIDNSSKIRFMAAAQDSSWAAEHFGVAVSTASNNNANDFTTIAEWTMTSRAMGNQKSQAKGFETKATGTWFQYEVDLSQYAGQEVWLAIRHFNCSDQFILCVDNVEIVSSDDNSTPEQPQQQYRNVLIEEFTGRNCPYCPMGHKALDDISNINPGKVFPVNIHAQNSLSPTSYPNLNIDVSTSYYNAFNNIGAIPSVMVNRVGESVYPANNECSNLVSQQLSQLAEVNIDGKVVINPDTRVAEITVELEYTSSSAYNTNYLTIMMLQDNIIGSQQGSSYNPEQIVDGQYRHMHVLRDVITPTWGDAVSPATAGTLITKQYIYNIPEIIGDPNGVEVDLDNIYFLAFVAETYQGTPTRPILNVNKLEQIEGVDEPVYAFIKDAVQENTSTCSYEKKFVLNIANAGTDNITSIEFEIDVEGGDITEYQWNGFIPSHENTDIDLFAYIPEGEHEVTFRIVAINGEYFYSEKTILAMSEKIVEVETSDANEQFTLELAQDRFGNQITWSVVGHNGNIIAEGGPYQMLSTVGTLLHVEYFTLPAGECAEFIINDNVGNGINGVFGQGYYKIYDSNYNVVVESDGKYENGESHIIYVNDDGETPYYWTPDPSLYANNMTVISTIAIDGVEQSDFNLELGAFCGDEVRGSGKLQYVGSPANRYECFLMVYGNAGDNITFKLYDHATETVSDLKTNQSVTFEVNGAVGDVINPYAINFTSTIVHNQELKSGWNWYSTYVVNEGAEGLANLENAVGTNGIQIKNQSKFVNQAGGNWYGTLTETSVEDMFMIQMSSATNVALEGYEVNPAEHPITLGTNWKWISYPLSTEMSVEEAFASANPSNGDYVKSQKGFAQYYEGLGWSGTLTSMTPGMGYMYQNVSGSAKTLVYPSSSSSKGSVKSNVTTDNNHWTADYSKYPMNMTMIAVVEGAESAYEVAAFADGECRGSARPIYVEALDIYIMFMTISGEDGETLTFKYYDVNTGETYAIADEFTFSVNATVGDVMEPYVMTRGTMGVDELSSSINIYPNPVDNELFLATEVRVEEIAIYDVYGRTTTVYGLQTTDFVHSIDVADLEAGVYFVNIKTENGNIVKRFVKK